MFKRGFKGMFYFMNNVMFLTIALEHGPIKLSTYLITFRVGDIVDIKANAAQQKGMPHKYYHGYVQIYHYPQRSCLDIF
jgi:ribosomal protein L21E